MVKLFNKEQGSIAKQKRLSYYNPQFTEPFCINYNTNRLTKWWKACKLTTTFGSKQNFPYVPLVSGWRSKVLTRKLEFSPIPAKGRKNQPSTQLFASIKRKLLEENIDFPFTHLINMISCISQCTLHDIKKNNEFRDRQWMGNLKMKNSTGQKKRGKQPQNLLD